MTTQENRSVSRLCLDQAGISADSKNQEDSWEWVKYVCSEEINGTIAVDARNCLPARLSVVGKYAERVKMTAPDMDGMVIANSLGRSIYGEFWHPPSAWGEVWNPHRDKVRMDGEAVEPNVKAGAEAVRKNWNEYFARFNM